MKENVKDLWVDALRSGKYEQTRLALKDDKGYCCLGVLCDVYAKTQKKRGFFRKMDGTIFSFGVTGHDCDLPIQVKTWARIQDNHILVSESKENIIKKTSQNYLMYLNDDQKKSFEDIAKFIEKNWREL